MQLFESRNVLDRLESAWKHIFIRDWQTHILIMILIVLSGMFICILSLIGGIYVLYPFVDITHEEILIACVLAIMFFTTSLITHAMMQTYPMSLCHDGGKGDDWKSLLGKSWKRIWGWAWFSTWMTLTLLGLIAIAGLLGYFTHWLGLIIAIPFMFWYIFSLSLGRPGYIIENSWGPSKFFSSVWYSYNRFWRTFGNMFLVGIVIGSATSLIQQIIFQLSGINSIILAFGAIDEKNVNLEAFEQVLSSITIIDIEQMGLALIFIGIIGSAVALYKTAFSYIVWSDIVTEVPGKDAKKGLQE